MCGAVWGHHYPKSAAVKHLISSDIHCRLMQEATIWSTNARRCANCSNWTLVIFAANSRIEPKVTNAARRMNVCKAPCVVFNLADGLQQRFRR